MKILNLLIIAFFCTIPAQGTDYKGQVLLETKVLREQDEKLIMSLEIHVQDAAVKDCQALLITPVLQAGSITKWFPYIQINGDNRQKMIKRWEKLRGKNAVYEKPFVLSQVHKEMKGMLSYQVEVPYEPWMDEATFSIRQEIWDCAGEKRLYTFLQQDKVDLEVREPYQPTPKVNYILPAAEVKQRKLQGQAYLDFQVGQSVLIPIFRRNPEELAKISGTITEVRANPDVTITGLYIEGYASPEGSYALNERLSRERADALSSYIQSTFGIDRDQIKVSSVAEDWNGLRTRVEQSDLAQKSRVLEIIDGDAEPDRKEQQLKALGNPYRMMLAEMFPPLRRVEYQIDYSVKEYTTDEARNLVGKNPEFLSQRELFLLAQTYPEDSEPFHSLIELTTRQYPDDPVADLNAAALMLSRGEYAPAKRLLDKVGVNADSYNNWGVYYLVTGDLEQARNYFTQAAASGLDQAIHNLAEVALKAKDNEKMQRYRPR